MTVCDNVAFGPRSRRAGRHGGRPPRARDAGGGAARRAGAPQAGPALRRPAAARGVGARPGQLPCRAAAGRTAGRAGSQAAPGHAARTQAHPARGADRVRVRDARPGRSTHDVGPHRRNEPGTRGTDRHAAADLPRAGHGVRGQLHRRGQPDPGARRAARRQRAHGHDHRRRHRAGGRRRARRAAGRRRHLDGAPRAGARRHAAVRRRDVDSRDRGERDLPGTGAAPWRAGGRRDGTGGPRRRRSGNRRTPDRGRGVCGVASRRRPPARGRREPGFRSPPR